MTVYSKEKGITRREAPAPPADRFPSYRQSRPERMQVPPNYSGHAIVDGEERPLGTLPTAEPPPPLPTPDSPTPRFDGLPRVSQLGDSHRRPTPTYLPAPAYIETASSPEEEESGTPRDPAEPPQSPPAPTDFPEGPPSATRVHPTPPTAAPRPLGILSLGTEELLLLGLILFLLMENSDCPDRGDLDETVILLGLLLLLG